MALVTPNRLAMLAALALAGCGPKPDAQKNLDTLDAQLTNTTNATDPALTSALHDQIMVDPTLAQQANDGTVRPPGRPASGAMPPDDIAAAAQARTAIDGGALKPAPAASRDCPQCTAARSELTLGALAQGQTGGKAKGCTDALAYSNDWAAKLPADVPLYPGARVTEAAGADTGTCSLRVVSFSTTASLQHLLDWYYTRTAADGYSVGHQDNGGEHMLAGTRVRDGATYVLFVRAKGNATDVDMVVNHGR